ncbi:unnamed protein product [Polarella glacialis]|uniref:Uncharacterized protein n=1 Tax=Polarella glacialis TaxID=89957 RepID=A0A813K1C8_POLGL|nr:unnamed protein product [Polarella glacialis]
MGAGASARLAAATAPLSGQQVEAVLRGFSEADRRKIGSALGTFGGSERTAASSSSAPPPSVAAQAHKQQAVTASKKAADVGNGGAGEYHITADDELEFELNQQERLFQQCMRSKISRDAKKKKDKQEKREADEKKRKQALEDAFDGEVEKLLTFVSDGWPIDTADAYGTTLLSEAAAGGSPDAIQVLLGSGADANTQGRNKRTPLWRASNAGYTECVQLLLRAGGDPRTPDEAGVKPYNVANGVEVKMLLECWDVSVTETLKEAKGAALKMRDAVRKDKEKKQRSEMEEALMQAKRKVQIAKTEVARKLKLVVTKLSA